MREYEQSFDPSRYAERAREQPEAGTTEPTRDSGGASAATAPIEFDRTERVMGYRLQVYSTTNIDDAGARRDYLRAVLDSAQIDMVFDAPYYKLRLGNFTDRLQAEEYKTELQSKGVNEAWIVRDKVLTTRKETLR
jgi:hypothetical protein